MIINAWDITQTITINSLYSAKDPKIQEELLSRCELDEDGEILESEANNKIVSDYFRELVAIDTEVLAQQKNAMDINDRIEINLGPIVILKKDEDGNPIDDSDVDYTEEEIEEMFEDFLDTKTMLDDEE